MITQTSEFNVRDNAWPFKVLDARVSKLGGDKLTGHSTLKPTVTPLMGDGARGRTRGLLNSESKVSHAPRLTHSVTLGQSLHHSETQALHQHPGMHKL